MDVLGVAEWVLIVLLLSVVAAIGWVWLRRRWLSRAGGSFACSYRPVGRRPAPHWILGIARYRAHELQWFPAFSLSLWPRQRFDRAAMKAGEQRVPDAVEAAWLLEGQHIVSLYGPVEVELAMAPDSLTGLLSWLEAGPPGMRYHPSTTSPD